MDCSTRGFSVHHQLLEPTQTHVHWVGDAIHLFLCHSFLLLASIFLFPNIRVFSSESVLPTRWSKYWSFSFSISPSNEYSDSQESSLYQHHSSKASVLQSSDFFIVQLSHPFMTIGKTIALTRWVFVGNVVSMLFNMLSKLVIAFLPRSKSLLISWLQSPSAGILEPQNISTINAWN